MQRENLVAIGLVLILIGCVFLAFSNSPVSVDNFNLRGSVDNSVTNPYVLNVSAYYNVGEHFAFNFTKGRFWGLDYETQHQGLEPFDPNFAPNASITSYKEVYFDIFTPSGDTFSVDVYVALGQNPFSVVYLNQSSAFTPLNGENFTNFARVDGTIEQAGKYTVEATLVSPPVMRNENITYLSIAGDPPQLMNLWTIQHVETKPYFLAFITLGAVPIVAGTVVALQGRKSKKSRRNHNAKTVMTQETKT